MKHLALHLCAVLVLVLVAGSSAASALGPKLTQLARVVAKGSAGPTVAAGTLSPSNHNLKWLPVIATATGGDCPTTCQKAGLVSVSTGIGSSTLCSFNQQILKVLLGQNSYRKWFDSGIKLNGDGCYYIDTVFGGPTAKWASTGVSAANYNGLYFCGCAKSGTATWRRQCLTTELNTYSTCRVTIGQGSSAKAWIGQVYDIGCGYAEAPGTKALKVSTSYDQLCDTYIAINRPISPFTVTGNSCAATCKARGMVEIDSGTAGLSLCARSSSSGTDVGVASNGTMPGTVTKGCFFPGVTASSPNPASKCPLTSGYLCYCQSTDPTKQPLWVSKAQAGSRGGSSTSPCQKWAAVPAGGASIKYVCRALVAGKWLLGTTPSNPSANADLCTVPGSSAGFYSACGQNALPTYDILCLQF